MKNKCFATVAATLALLCVVTIPVFAEEFPYSFSVIAPNLCNNSSFNTVGPGGTPMGFGGDFAMIGVYDSLFTGSAVTKITLFLCAGQFGNQASLVSDTSVVTIGVFTKSATPTLVASLGTLTYDQIGASGAQLICNAGHACPNVSNVNNTAPVSFTVTGSSTMQSGQVIGVSFNSGNNNHAIVVACGGTCGSTDLPKGGSITPTRSGSAINDSPGFAIAGSFTFTNPPAMAARNLDNAIVAGSALLTVLVTLGMVVLIVLTTQLIATLIVGRLVLSDVFLFGVGILFAVILAAVVLALLGSFDPVLRGEGFV